MGCTNSNRMTYQVNHSAKAILFVDVPKNLVTSISQQLAKAGFHNIINASKPADGRRHLIAYAPELCIVDIRTPQKRKQAIQFVEEIRSSFASLPVVFIYNKASEAIYEQCRHLQPIYFIQQASTPFTLKQTVEVALINHQYTKKNKALQSKTTQASNDSYFFKIDDVYKRIPLEGISFFFSRDKQTFAKVNKKNIPISSNLKTLTIELKEHFERVHKKYLININRIERIKTKENVVAIDDEHIPIGHAYKKTLLHRIPLLR